MNPQPQVAVHYVNDGTLMNHVKDYFSKTASHFDKGDIATAEDAAREYVEQCAGTAQEMAEAAK